MEVPEKHLLSCNSHGSSSSPYHQVLGRHCVALLLSLMLMVSSTAQAEAPFYEEWWFLLVMALSSLLLILLVVFVLVLHGQSKKYKSCSTGVTSVSPYGGLAFRHEG